MIKIRKLISIILSCFFCLTAGCSSANVGTDKNSDTFVITTTIFPIYDFVRNVVGDELISSGEIEVNLLISSGIDMHSYEPSVADVAEVMDSDLFIYVGGESDEWADELTLSGANGINLFDMLGEDELTYEELGEEEEKEFDEHVWLSIRNAQVIVGAIADKLEEIDSDNSGEYEANSSAYIAQLETLDKEYEECVNSANAPMLIFADRFPFRYMCLDYGIAYDAAFEGCEAETEASFETVIRLADELTENDLKYVIIIDGSTGDVAQAVIDASALTDIKTLTLDSMQSVTEDELAAGLNYIGVMTDNLEVLREALDAA